MSRCRFLIAGAVLVCAALNMPTAGTSGVAIATSLGLGPEAIAAAGGDESTARQILISLEKAEGELGGVRLGESSVDALIGRHGEVTGRLTENPAEPDLLAEAERLEREIATAASALSGARAQLVSAALRGLPESNEAGVRQYLASGGRRLPAAMRLVVGLPAETNRLEVALATEARAPETLPQEARSIVLSYRSRADVVAAQSGLELKTQPVAVVFANWSK